MRMAKPHSCCISCKNIQELFSLYETHECSDFGDVKASATMLNECFNIEVTPSSNFTSICGQCMLRLRDAYLFRKNIIKSMQGNEEFSSKMFHLQSSRYFPSMWHSRGTPCITKKSCKPLSTRAPRILDIHGGEAAGNKLEKQVGFITDPDNTVVPNANAQSKHSESGSNNLTQSVKKNNILNVVSHENTLLIELSPLKISKETDSYQDAKQRDASDNQYTVQPGQTECTFCKLSFPTTKSLQGHMNVHFGRYVCDKCSARFEADHKLRRHMATVHMEGPFICTICDQTYSKLNSLNAHIWRVHQALDPYKCSKCDERFRTFHKRLRHLQEAHGMTEPKYPCPYCEKKFFYAGSRSTHIRLTHLQERQYKCTHCPMAFGKRRMLLGHMSAIHDIGEKRHQCHKCQKSFFRSNTLKYHMKTHENAEQKLHQCSMCDARFSYKNHLKFHIKRHKGAQKEYLSDECHKNDREENAIMEFQADSLEEEQSIIDCHKDTLEEHSIIEYHKDTLEEEHSIIECHKDTLEEHSIIERHKDTLEEEQSIIECHALEEEQPMVLQTDAIKEHSMENSVVIVEDTPYDFTNDTVYLEIYET